MNQQIAIKIRNHFFTQDARKRGLQKEKRLQNELQNWRDKWVYEAARSHFTQNLTIEDEEAQNYFSRNKDRYKIRVGEKPTFKQYAFAAKVFFTFAVTIPMRQTQERSILIRIGKMTKIRQLILKQSLNKFPQYVGDVFYTKIYQSMPNYWRFKRIKKGCNQLNYH